VVHFLFPKFFSGPYSEVDPRIVSLWLAKVKEIQPLWPRAQEGWASLAWYLGAVPAAVPAALIFFWEKRQDRQFQGWLLVILGFAIYIPLTLYQCRWATYAQALMLIPLTELLSRVIRREDSWLGPPWRIIARSFTVVLFCLGPFLLYCLLAQFNVASKTNNISQDCSLSALSRYLTEDPRWRDNPKRLLTYIDFGPEILYRTPHEVIGTPYIRNSAGILDTFGILAAATDAEAHHLIHARGINLILLCPSYPEAASYAGAASSSFHQRLMQGNQPPWLRPISVPPDLAKSFRLFAVVG
jgi:hypothetical protein